MEEHPKINFGERTFQSGSKWTLIKYIVYLLSIAILLVVLYFSSKSSEEKKEIPSGKEVKEINGVTIED